VPQTTTGARLQEAAAETVRQGIRRPQDLHPHLFSILLLPAAVRVAQAEAAEALPIPAAAEAAAALPIPAAAEAVAQVAEDPAVAAVAQAHHQVVHHHLLHTAAAAEAGDNIYK
jgi:hypothetical protein